MTRTDTAAGSDKYCTQHWFSPSINECSKQCINLLDFECQTGVTWYLWPCCSDGWLVPLNPWCSPKNDLPGRAATKVDSSDIHVTSFHHNIFIEKQHEFQCVSEPITGPLGSQRCFMPWLGVSLPKNSPPYFRFPFPRNDVFIRRPMVIGLTGTLGKCVIVANIKTDTKKDCVHHHKEKNWNKKL